MSEYGEHRGISPPWAGAPVAGVSGPDFSHYVVEVARSRDRAAFARLFDHYAPRLKRYFMQTGVAAGQAEDLVQETLLLLWRKAALFDPAAGTASSWIFTLARNLRIDAARRTRHQAPGEDLSAMPDEVTDPERALISTDAKNRLRQALSDLPEASISLVLLAFFEDKSHRVIERELGVPLGTIKARIRRALLRLRASLGDTL